MCGVLAESVQAGALGLSLSFADSDENGTPVASVFADVRERIALAKTVVANGRTFIQSVRHLSTKTFKRRTSKNWLKYPWRRRLVRHIAGLDQPIHPGIWKEDLLQLERYNGAAPESLGNARFGPSILVSACPALSFLSF